MASAPKNIPPDKTGLPTENTLRTAADFGDLVRERRRLLALTQTDVAGLGNTGNRFIIELERGKPTVQLQKALDVLELLGLEIVVRPKSGARL